MERAAGHDHEVEHLVAGVDLHTWGILVVRCSLGAADTAVIVEIHNERLESREPGGRTRKGNRLAVRQPSKKTRPETGFRPPQ